LVSDPGNRSNAAELAGSAEIRLFDRSRDVFIDELRAPLHQQGTAPLSGVCREQT
jgi:hypothetical protein